MLENLRRKSLVKTYIDPRYLVRFGQGHVIYGNISRFGKHIQRFSKEKAEASFTSTFDVIFPSFVYTCMESEFRMIYCPSGTFTMGHKDNRNNQPREETIESPFLLGETEITQELYKKVIGKNPSSNSKNSQNPVEWVSWVDAILFCNKLSKLEDLNECYSVRKTKVGILRSEMPSDKKELVRYNKFYDSIRSFMLDGLEKNNFYDVEFEIEYDPTVSSCDVVITDRKKDVKYSIESNWADDIESKHSLNLANYLGVNPYLLNKDIKKKLDDLLPKCRIPIVECNFGKNGYRLPREKEWEYAAKAGTQNKWVGTDKEEELDKYAWFGEDWRKGGSTHPVKTKKPNEWGFYDMSGNVDEWCWDKYDPKAPDISANRVRRGGSWLYDTWELRSAFRNSSSPNDRFGTLGFRVCRSIVN